MTTEARPAECRKLPTVGVRRLAYRPDEAAASIGVGRSFFYAEVLPELRCVRRGRVRLVPIAELKKWLDRNAARALEVDSPRLR